MNKGEKNNFLKFDWKNRKFRNKSFFSEYATCSKREGSFADWPIEYIIRSKDLCDSGFFYAGDYDTVTCFSCGGVLKNWLPLDDINYKHAFYFPHCEFIIDIKGIDYVKAIKHKKIRDQDNLICSVCLDRVRNILFVPCGHFTTCKECTRQLVTCPICRELIREEKTVYLS